MLFKPTEEHKINTCFLTLFQTSVDLDEPVDPTMSANYSQ